MNFRGNIRARHAHKALAVAHKVAHHMQNPLVRVERKGVVEAAPKMVSNAVKGHLLDEAQMPPHAKASRNHYDVGKAAKQQVVVCPVLCRRASEDLPLF